MWDHYVGYTLGDIVGLAHEHAITYWECAEILEQELQRKFPLIKPDEFYQNIKRDVCGPLDYCERLVKAKKQLEEMARN